ncbi:saponin hydrolase precursor [Xylaria digitata]|nr:saponin hydrolase precursor [Xylaria digitata]
MHSFRLTTASAFGVLCARLATATVPDPPAPEPIEVVELPLPPVTTGSCTPDINPKGTGCISQGMYGDGFQSGSFLPDGRHIVAYVTFTGAPETPDPASIYNGSQIILIKTDNTSFPNGDPWKCVTCGVPAENSLGKSDTWDYPHAFQDGQRLLVGANIVDCGEFLLTDSDCTPERTFIYPIRWNVTPDGSGAGGAIRELRLHPDNVHLGFNSFVLVDGTVGQFSYFSRLQFNSAPTTGEPLVPRYDLVNVTMLYSPNNTPPLTIDGDQITLNPLTNQVGELRGFSGRGGEVTYIGYPTESCNIDLYAVELATGSVRRLTAHPEYVDPADVSPDDQWTVVMDTRGTNRQMFMAGMRGVPPLIDIVATTVASSIRNNHQRRFFEPYLIDRYGDRGDYSGQKINEAGSGVAGSGAINDPEWNGRADPRWSPDGTKIAYWQDLTASPACGGVNPLPCYKSTAQGGRFVRFMLATLTSREPHVLPSVEPVSDVVPWGTPYVPGDPAPTLPRVPQGTYTLSGTASGSAEVTITENTDDTSIKSVAVQYSDYSDDSINFINGYENYTRSNPSPSLEVADWYSDLVRTGETYSTKKTSPDGFHPSIDLFINIFEANGTLTTTVDDDVYLQPLNFS